MVALDIRYYSQSFGTYIFFIKLFAEKLIGVIFKGKIVRLCGFDDNRLAIAGPAKKALGEMTKVLFLYKNNFNNCEITTNIGSIYNRAEF